MALADCPSDSSPLILAIDTSSLTGSVALCRGATLLAESLLHLRSTHSERLLVQIEQVLAMTGVSVEQLDLLAVVHGPGSFTGLRVGLATAKGLATAAGIPVVGFSTLEVLAMNLPLCPYPVCAFLDARKQEVYSGLFDCREGFPVAVGEEAVLPPADLLQRLEGDVALVGDAVPLYRSLIEQQLGTRAKLPPAVAHQPRASAVAALAARRYAAGELPTTEALTPRYIRPSDADLPKSRGGSGAS
jgi:tRNA threonylcarbamoyladenosine biosynthesis protein TsaB